MNNEHRVLRFTHKYVVLTLILSLLMAVVGNAKSAPLEQKHKVVVSYSRVEDTIHFFKSRDFWGSTTHGKNLDVPRIIIAVTAGSWEEESQKVDVETKKELFYRAIVPMILLSNELIRKERAKIEVMDQALKQGKNLSQEQLGQLYTLAERYSVEKNGEPTDPGALIAELSNRVNTIPPSLALGQAAYESGYGTSRFAREGNALFGQWTYSSDGMKPKEHRAHKGDYGVASYRWPFDSVRSYMLNINTHSAYQLLRDKRAELMSEGQDISGLELAETLVNYSEKGSEYVETLKDIITTNNLSTMDTAFLRDEPITLVVGVAPDEDKKEVESELSRLNSSGELDRIIKVMDLE